MRFLVTAGPTREALDPIRFLSNRSTGKMGYALAIAARDRGHAVQLISGPVALTPPAGVDVCAVTSAAEMYDAVLAALPSNDVLIMAAAVADWTPACVAPHKLKKHAGPMQLELVRTRDILAAVKTCRRTEQVIVGFAAETRELLAEAERKLREKGLDLIVANDVSQPDAGFATDTNRVVLLDGEGGVEQLPLASKSVVAARIVARVEQCVSECPRRLPR